MNPYRILKLRSGESIITKISGKKKNKLLLKNPMLMRINSIADPFNNVRREILTLSNWLEYSSANEVAIPEDWIALFLPPDAQAVRLYEAEINKPDLDLKELEDMLKRKEKENKEREDNSEMSPLDQIFMSFSINQDIFKKLVEEGFLEDELELEDLEEDDVIDNENGLHEELESESDHRSGKEEDFGNSWNDWSPDLRDYL